MKITYKYWINNKWYHFKSFKVYWAYRWWIAEQRDKEGVQDPTDKTFTKKVFTTDSLMFLNSYT